VRLNILFCLRGILPRGPGASSKGPPKLRRPLMQDFLTENINPQCWICNKAHYLFKKFLVSDWLTANCEIVISTQWPTKYGFFAFILAKWPQRVNMKKIWTRLRHITMTTKVIMTRWRHWYDDDDGCRRTKELFFFLIQIKYKCFEFFK
jgi:hypothetical protein